MKKKIHLFIYIFLAFTLFQSCNKTAKKAEVKETRNYEIKINQAVEINWGSFGDEESVYISKQATHFATSEIVRKADYNSIYTYLPIKDYVGDDELQIKTNTGNDGFGNGATITIYTIKITITK